MSTSSRFINAVQSSNHSVIYTDSNGKHFRYYDGTWAWRNHNPGNLFPGHVSKRNHQIGVIVVKQQKFAVFPDYESGHEALIDSLNTTYPNMSIDQMIIKFAPPKDNPTKMYMKLLHEKTGVKDDRKIKDFTPAEFEKLWKAIEHIEKWTEGKTVEVYPILEVRTDKSGIICEYFIDPDGWISKKNCIDLAKQRKIELEVCNKQTGDTYLRSYPNNQQVGIHIYS